FLRKSPEPRLAGGRGKASADVNVKKGIGTGPVDLVARGAEARYTDALIRADAAVRGQVKRWDFERETIDLSGTSISLTRASSSGRHQDSREWWGSFELDSARVERGFRTDVRAHCRDARPLFRLFDVELPGWAQGLLKLEGFEAKARVGLA